MLVEVQRAYGGQEGKRVRRGDQFWVQIGKNKGPDGVRVITKGRHDQLKGQRLVAAVDPLNKSEGPSRPKQEPRQKRPAVAPQPGAKVEPDSAIPRPRQARASSKLAAPKGETVRRRASTAQGKATPGGGQQAGGRGAPSSSSPAGPQTAMSTLKQRGNRRGQASAGSSSTTPTGSAPGQTSSTPATQHGGGSTTGSEDSAAFA